MTADQPALAEVAFHAAGLDEEGAAAVRAALGRAGLAVLEGAARTPYAVTGPHAAAVKLLGGDSTVVSVAVTTDRGSVSELLASGAAGVVALADVAETLAPALFAVAAGLTVTPRGAREAAARPVLSAREKQVLGLVVLGLTNADIGRRLFLAESTVKFHLQSVFKKLGVRSRKEAADLVLDSRNGLDAGVLGITPGERRGVGYSEPVVR